MTFQQLLAILRGRLMLIVSTVLLCFALGATVTLMLPKQYAADVSLVLDFNEPVSGLVPQALLSTSYVATQMDIIRSPRVALRVVEALKLTDDLSLRQQFQDQTQGAGRLEDWLASLLLNHMDVVPSRESRVVDIVYRAADPQLAAVIANAFAQAYVDTSLELNVAPAKQNAEWFDKQLADLRNKVDAAQSKLTAYQRKRGIVGTDERLDIENSRLNALSAQLAAAQVDAQDAENKLRQLRDAEERAGGRDTFPEILANNFIQAMKADLLRQEAKLQELTQSLGRNHPEYKQAAADVVNIKEKLSREMNKVVEALRTSAQISVNRQKDLTRAVDEQKLKVLSMRQGNEELPALVREAEAAQRAYDAALERFNQQTLQSRSNQTNVVVLNPAVPPLQPARPRVMLNLALSLFFGVFFGVNLALVTEMRRRRLRSEDDFAMSLTTPLLGRLPYARVAEPKPGKHAPAPIEAANDEATHRPLGQILVDIGRMRAETTDKVLQYQKAKHIRFGQAAVKLKVITAEDLDYALARQFNYRCVRPGEAALSLELVTAYRPFSAQVEAMRHLRSQLAIRWFNKEHKTLAIIGADVGDGCSYVAANLAVTFAQLGSRTLLLDADLRVPRQHQIFGLNNDEGLSTYLSGQCAQLPVVHIPQFSGLTVAPTGPEPPNPHELVSTPRMNELLTALRAEFDVILIDTHGTSAAADALTVAAVAGGALLVTRKNKSQLRHVTELEKDLINMNVPIVGATLNEA